MMLAVTELGRAVAQSGLRPKTAIYLLRYFAHLSRHLGTLLPRQNNQGQIDNFHWLVFYAGLVSPEFESRQTGGTRQIPFPLSVRVPNSQADALEQLLAERPWAAHSDAANGASICLNWINGTEMRDLERFAPHLSAGMLRNLFQDLAWLLSGFSTILDTALRTKSDQIFADTGLAAEAETAAELSRVPRLLRRQAFRLAHGLPDDVAWMVEIPPTPQYRLRRSEILSLRARGIVTPVQAADNDLDATRIEAFAGARPDPRAKNNWFKQAAREWKVAQRQKMAERHVRRAELCPRRDLVPSYYQARQNEFESVFEEILEHLNINFIRFDDGKKRLPPDYVVTIDDLPPLIVELKSKTSEKLVDLNAAVEVLSASEVHGHSDKHCVTVCHPGVDPSVLDTITRCPRLSIVESTDLAEALLRLCEGKIDRAQLHAWLSAPGQANMEDLPYRQSA